MKNFSDVLSRSSLFGGISGEEIASLLHCLEARTLHYHKNEYVLTAGQQVDCIGLLLSGSASIIQEDFWGNCNMIAKLHPGQMFAEAFACSGQVSPNVSVVTDSPADIMFLNVQKVLDTCPSSCAFHSRMIRNLLIALADKNLLFNEKLTHMAQRTTREKLLSFLSAQSIQQGSPEFDIPFNRQQLADYLSVDRSAMSHELGKLRDEGVLRFDRNHFTLFKRPGL